MNREAILDICGVKEVFEVPQALMKKLFSPEQSDLLNRIAVIYCDRQLDQFRDFFQEEGADRKKLKQDYTPDGVAELLARVSVSGKSLADICAGTGSLTIQYLNYHPDVEFVRCEAEIPSHYAVFFPNDKVLPKYLYHTISFQARRFIYTIQTGMNIQMDTLSEMKLKIHTDFEKQVEIVRYLDVIEKMETKEEATIESLKQAKQTNLNEMFAE